MAYIPPHLYEKRVSKANLRNWLMENGLWERFVKIREHLKQEGVNPSDAWGKAAYQLESMLKGGEVVEEPVGTPEEEDQVKSVQVTPTKMPTMLKDDMDEDKVSRKAFLGRSCSTPETVEWVAANVMVEDAAPLDAPSPEAWGMLCWARRSNTNEAQFWGQIYTKLLPSRTSLEGDAKYRDDGRQLIGLIEMLEMESGVGKETDTKGNGEAEADPQASGLEGLAEGERNEVPDS